MPSLPGADSKQDLEKGHLLGHQFGGLDIPENLVPEFWAANHGSGPNQMGSLERQVVGQLAAGRRVYYSAIPVYSPNGYPGLPANIAPYVPVQINITWGTSPADLQRVPIYNIP